MIKFFSKFYFGNKGFTLAELLIILSIIFILITFSIQGLKSVQPGVNLSLAARDLLTNLRYAQQLTITEQVNYCIKFFLLEKKYQIIKCSEVQPFLEIMLPVEIQTITTSFTDNKIEFNPYGAVKQSGTIILENTENKTKTIEVRPSGFVKITI